MNPLSEYHPLDQVSIRLETNVSETAEGLAETHRLLADYLGIKLLLPIGRMITGLGKSHQFRSILRRDPERLAVTWGNANVSPAVFVHFADFRIYLDKGGIAPRLMLRKEPMTFGGNQFGCCYVSGMDYNVSILRNFNFMRHSVSHPFKQSSFSVSLSISRQPAALAMVCIKESDNMRP